MRRDPGSTISACALFLCSVLLPCGAARAAENYCSEISEIKGTVEVLAAAASGWHSAVEGMGIAASDRLRTRDNSSCTLELDDGSVIFIDGNTDATVNVLELTREKHTSELSLWFGKLLARITPSKNTKMRIRTPTMTAAVRGTEFAVDATPEKAGLGVFEGAVAVSGNGAADGAEVVVNPDEETAVLKGKAPERPRRLQEVMLRQRERMQNLRERSRLIREKLQRTTPEEIRSRRLAALTRFRDAGELRREQKNQLQRKRDALRNRTR